MLSRASIAPILGLVLVLALPLGTSACSKGQETTTTTAAMVRPATTEAPSSTTTTIAAETSTTEAPQQPLTLRVATAYEQSSPGGQIVQHFCDYVEEETAGVVDFEIYFANDLANVEDDLQLVSSGAVDLISLDTTAYADRLPLLGFPAAVPPDAQTAVDYFNQLVFQDKDTSALIHAEASKRDLVYLGCATLGANVLVSTQRFGTLAELAGKKFGGSAAAAAFKTLGMTVADVALADVYQALSKGDIEATDMPLVTAVRLKLYEVAKYFALDGTGSPNFVLAVNQTTWDQLTSETQKTMRDAAKDTTQYSLDLEAETSEAALRTLGDSGASLVALTTEDKAALSQDLFDAGTAACMTRAERLGIADNMSVVLQAAAAFAGLDWKRAQQ